MSVSIENNYYTKQPNFWQSFGLGALGALTSGLGMGSYGCGSFGMGSYGMMGMGGSIFSFPGMMGGYGCDSFGMGSYGIGMGCCGGYGMSEGQFGMYAANTIIGGIFAGIAAHRQTKQETPTTDSIKEAAKPYLKVLDLTDIEDFNNTDVNSYFNNNNKYVKAVKDADDAIKTCNGELKDINKNIDNYKKSEPIAPETPTPISPETSVTNEQQSKYDDDYKIYSDKLVKYQKGLDELKASKKAKEEELEKLNSKKEEAEKVLEAKKDEAKAAINELKTLKEQYYDIKNSENERIDNKITKYSNKLDSKCNVKDNNTNLNTFNKARRAFEEEPTQTNLNTLKNAYNSLKDNRNVRKLFELLKQKFDDKNLNWN